MVLIEHREFIGNVTTSASANTFSATTYDLNPGQAAAFRWLSNAANGFVRYYPELIEFMFISTSASAISSTTNQQLGVVCGTYQYDVTIDQDNTMRELLQTHGAKTHSPTVTQLYKFDGRTLDKLHYSVRIGGQPTLTDLRLIDVGKFTIATDGFQGTSQNIGQLWVHYKFHLMMGRTPIQAPLGYTCAGALFRSTGSITSAAPLTNMTATAANNPLGFTVSTTALTFPSTISTGRFAIVWSGYVAATTTFVGNAANTYVGATAVAGSFNLEAAPVQAGAATTDVMKIDVVDITAPSAVITIVITTLGTTCTAGALRIMQINSDFT